MIKDLVVADKVSEIVAPIKSEVKYLGSLKPCKGHTCYELDLKTKIITEAKLESVNADINGKVRSKVIVKDGCLYVTALNKLNADHKFGRMLGLKRIKK